MVRVKLCDTCKKEHPWKPSTIKLVASDPVEDHEPAGFGEGEHELCQHCKRDICDEPGYKYRNQTYEEAGYCIPCIAVMEGWNEKELFGFLGAENRRRA